MQIQEGYTPESASVKPSPQCGRVTCRIRSHGGCIRFVGTMAEVLAWMRECCPDGKLVELVELARTGNLAEVAQ